MKMILQIKDFYIKITGTIFKKSDVLREVNPLECPAYKRGRSNGEKTGCYKGDAVRGSF